MKRNKILVECYNDEALFLSLKISKYDIEHNIEGKGEVLKKIEKKTNCLAVIDNDKRTEHDYFKQSKLDKNLSDDIKIFIDSNKNNYILVFYPKLEKVIERIINENENNKETAKKLGLKTDVKSLHDIGSNREKLTKLKQLFNVLIERSSEFKQIKDYL